MVGLSALSAPPSNSPLGKANQQSQPQLNTQSYENQIYKPEDLLCKGLVAMSFLVLPHHDSNRPANETIVACNYLNLMRQPPTAYSEEIGVDLGSVKAQP